MTKLILIFLFIFFFTLPLFAQSVDTAWVRRYNGPGNADDSAVAIAIDNSGNVYVTGKSWVSGTGSDYATVKYDSQGNQLWVERYNGPGNADDSPVAIAVDDSGNVYVTGSSYGSGTQVDYATIKYDSQGNELWVKRYNYPSNLDDYPFAIAVDNSGNVYVTGYSRDGGTRNDYATVKYDSQGNELWVKRYNGPLDHDDDALAIAVDDSGNVYVTGQSWGNGTDRDYATIKYDSQGNELWVKRYNGPGNAFDNAFAIAVDNSGNVYVAGYSYGSGTDYDYATIKYDSQGNELWVKRYNGSENSDDKAVAMAVDNSGNVYVTGYSYGSGTSYDYATIKYDSQGNQLGVESYNGLGNSDDKATAMTVDDSGNVYVTGYSYGSGTSYDYATIKYDSLGNQLWVQRYNGPADSLDVPLAIAVDDSGNVYVTGASCGSGTSEDYATIKYWQNHTPKSFSLILPLNTDSVKTPVALKWQKAIDPDPNDTVRYDLYLSRSPVFNPDSTLIYDSLLDTSFVDSIGLKTWYWQAKAYDRWGATRWSDQNWSFYVYLCGDCNGDGLITVADVVYAINYLFKGGPVLKPLMSGDANCDSKVTVADVVYTISYLFKGGPKPCQNCS